MRRHLHMSLFFLLLVASTCRMVEMAINITGALSVTLACFGPILLHRFTGASARKWQSLALVVKVVQ